MGSINTVKLQNAFAAVCFLTGLLVILFSLEGFTAHSLIETILFVAGFLFLLSKYFTSRVIVAYQDGSYAPAKNVRIVQDILVNVGVFVVQPVCLAMLYACVPLLAIKFVAPDKLNFLAESVYSLYRFNDEYIKQPKAILIGVLSIVTLLNFLSLKYFQRIKEYIKYLTFPLATIATLVLFIHMDKGIDDSYITWAINKSKPDFSNERLTFNTTQREHARQLIDSYVEAMVTELLNQTNSRLESNGDTIALAEIEISLAKLVIAESKEPFIKADLYQGLGKKPTGYSPSEIGVLDKTLKVSRSQPRTTTSADLYEITKTENGKKFSQIIEILNDERKSIHIVKEAGKNEVILKELLKKHLLDGFVGGVSEHVHVYTFLKDPAFDLIKSRIADGFSHLIKRSLSDKISRLDFAETFRFLRNSLGDQLKSIGTSIIEKKKLIAGFESDYTDAVSLRRSLTKQLASKEDLQTIRTLVEKFPNDPDFKYWKNMEAIYDLENDITRINDIDIDFFRERLRNFRGEPNVEAFIKVLDQTEQARYISIAENSQRSLDWKNVINKYPSHPQKGIILKNIAITEQNEALAYATTANSEAGWLEYMRQYPESELNPTIRTYLQQNELGLLRQQSTLFAERNMIRFGSVARGAVQAESFWIRFLRVASKVRLR